MSDAVREKYEVPLDRTENGMLSEEEPRRSRPHFYDVDPSWDKGEDFRPCTPAEIQRGDDGLDRLLGRGKYAKR